MDTTKVPGLEEHLAEPTYMESVRRYHEREQRENRARWHAYHSGMAQLHSRLAAEHEAKALALLEEESLDPNREERSGR